MAGYGTEHYGIDYYGAGTGVDEVTSGTIIVQPESGSTGIQFIIGGSPHDFISSSRNDSFNPSYNAGLWNMSTGGSVFLLDPVPYGMSVKLNAHASGSQFMLNSISTYDAGDLSFVYQIVSPYTADTTSVGIVYASMSMRFSLTTYLTVSRVLDSGGRHYAKAELVTPAGVTTVGSTHGDLSDTGVIRMVKCGSIIEVFHNSYRLARINDTTLSSFSVRLNSQTYEDQKHVNVIFKSYRSDTGISFGEWIVNEFVQRIPSRVLGVVPTPESYITIQVKMFNHSGIFALSSNRFTYVNPSGVQVSHNSGLDGVIFNDSTLRD